MRPIHRFFVRGRPTFLPPAPAPATVRPGVRQHAGYLPVRWKFGLASTAALLWAALAVLAAQPWLDELGTVVGPVPAHLAIFGIAVLPGFMNAFLVASLLMDRRPGFVPSDGPLPGISILVAAYNEAENIAATVQSIAAQRYPGPLQVVVIDDGSTDGTAERLAALSHPWLEVIRLERNGGKARALNAGLERARFGLTITVDGDSLLYRNALSNLVRRYLSDPVGTKVVAGAVLVRNSRRNLLTRTQEWDYFHGIAAVKRVQSLYQGTLVAQGAFSLYETSLLRRLGGWPATVGEDIVLTWRILAQGHRVGYAENACLFTNVPERWGQFFRQRQRWARGMIEAFKAHPELLLQPRMSTMFIWWNLFFPYLDLVYTLVFLPGLVLACFGLYWIAGPVTLLVLPLALLVNGLMFRVQTRMFVEQGLKVRRNPVGFVFYALLYSLVLQPACVLGYLDEILNRAKRWGTK